MSLLVLIALEDIAVAIGSLIHVQLFATPWTAAHQAPLSFTISQSLLKLMSIELVMPSKHLICNFPLSSCLQSFPASGSFPVSQLFASGGQSFGASTSASVLPMNIQGLFPLELTDLISLLSKGLSSMFVYLTIAYMLHIYSTQNNIRSMYIYAYTYIYIYIYTHTWFIIYMLAL